MSDSQTIIDKVVVPVAGLGTRLLPATKSQPKEMLPVGRKPVVQYVVEEMVQQGLRYMLLVTGATKQSIENHLDTDPQLMERLLEAEDEDLARQVDFELEGAQIFYTRQAIRTGARKPAGLGDAIRHAHPFVGRDPFVVALGDSIIRANGKQTLVKRLCDTHIQEAASVTIAVREVDREATRRYGIVQPVEGSDLTKPFAIEDIVEKPRPGDAPSNYAVAARYAFSSEIFDALDVTLPGHGGEIQLTDAIRSLVRSGRPVWCVPLQPHETRFDIGNPETYFKAFVDFAFRDGQVGETVRTYARELLEEYNEKDT
jgi:UTP--glucose-1-phosphate uridylyltransferase